MAPAQCTEWVHCNNAPPSRSEMAISLERKSCKHKLQTQSDTSLVPFETIAHVPFLSGCIRSLLEDERVQILCANGTAIGGKWERLGGRGVVELKGEISLFRAKSEWCVLCRLKKRDLDTIAIRLFSYFKLSGRKFFFFLRRKGTSTSTKR